MSNPIKLIIVEGESRDYRFVNEMTDCFFKGKYSATIINLPASKNLYMLYKILQEDDFETDIVEILRETVEEARVKLEKIKRQEIDEVYMFFDYDRHQDNISSSMPNAEDILSTLLETFDNETENGRLYISYPMVEALYDYHRGQCNVFSSCYLPIDVGDQYKELSGSNNPNASKRLTINYWREILNVFYLRIKCLFCENSIDYFWYKSSVTPKSIYQIEKTIGKDGNVFVLSAFPEFLFDYFKKDFFESMTRIKKKRCSTCPKN